jgi:hypothetical protein
MEQRIRELCTELLAEKNPERIEVLAAQLRAAFHRYVEETRGKVAAFAEAEAAKHPFGSDSGNCDT